jgi:hypothetical protein
LTSWLLNLQSNMHASTSRHAFEIRHVELDPKDLCRKLKQAMSSRDPASRAAVNNCSKKAGITTTYVAGCGSCAKLHLAQLVADARLPRVEQHCVASCLLNELVMTLLTNEDMHSAIPGLQNRCSTVLCAIAGNQCRSALHPAGQC